MTFDDSNMTQLKRRKIDATHLSIAICDDLGPISLFSMNQYTREVYANHILTHQNGLYTI